MNNTLIATLICDCYKSGHKFQYPAGLDSLFLNITPRNAKYFPGGTDVVANFGSTAFRDTWLVKFWNEHFFDLPKDVVMEIHEMYMDGVLGKGTLTHDHIAALHDLGYLPIIVRALPEGTVSPVKVPVMTIETTHKDFAWVGGYLEDLFSSNLWKVMTIATIAMKYRVLLERFAEETGVDKGFVDYQAHDFALRGMSGVHDDIQHNIGHLAFFKGTDSFPATWAIKQFYGDVKVSDIAGSVPATEHSVTCANIAVEASQMVLASGEFGDGNPQSKAALLAKAEQNFFHRLLTEVYPTGILSVVGDTNNWYDTVTTKVRELKDVIMKREGKLVLRPDSGIPEHIVAGYRCIEIENAKAVIAEEYKSGRLGWASVLESNLADIKELTIDKLTANDCQIIKNAGFEVVVDAEDFDGAYCVFLDEKIAKPSVKVGRYVQIEVLEGAVESLWKIFGGDVTTKGYKVLDEHIGLIYGDSITLERAGNILQRLKERGFASCNVVFGVGSFTYQMITRDSLSFAIKATVATVDGINYPLSKDPITDDGTKKSATGYIIVRDTGTGEPLHMVDGLSRQAYDNLNQQGLNELRVIFADGESINYDENILTIRAKFLKNMK
ncbi:nicotinamide phosphoribosyltransferase [Salmonella phage vB_SenM_SB18]|uniref:Nicotinamide phosphoribosyltransferase n=1 Tax=Salmonella phage vB_SenM_SB18 TaxID=2698415 RepID=A0A6B9RPC0_9CAUD|nr:nicotinamide phosphoribosyltransferase [Salmonella phage vB_SenM_SB18]